ncbi:hypothetical protein ROE7235_03845 [Roseibaca ekhonensis]|jgi:hypothetical protein|uniref:Uncharacterized protein n=3 Tax=Rhodobacterales TaxID=204455 RepID=A0A0L6CSN5_9RHOB|nr:MULTISPECIES: hypothetical protein [Rhodobacterales]KNX40680.1 hypothetical protein ROTO_27480 [Roseovarius tolerans]SLN77279.1 hypothetical protein ROA7023_04345 [Roseisalinus antarcticus]SUZ34064.1 hypothetical protein ROE7235_03845 [Roseibaca ekhonensis]
MPRFRVKITRDVTESTFVSVEALSPEAAQVAAFKVLADMENAVWTLDEGSWNAGGAYVSEVASEE